MTFGCCPDDLLDDFRMTWDPLWVTLGPLLECQVFPRIPKDFQGFPGISKGFPRPRDDLGIPFGRLLGDFWMTFGPPGRPLEVQGQFYIDLGCHYGGLGALFSDEDRAAGHDFSIHAFGVVLGCIFLGFMIGQGGLEHEKPCKFIVMSFKIKG